MIRTHNVHEFVKYSDKTSIVFNGIDGMCSASIDLNTVGPCAVYLQMPDEGKNKGKRFLLACVEGIESIAWAVPGDAVKIELEPSGEVWFRKPPDTGAADNPTPDVTFTRMEKLGMYEEDEIEAALNRQAILQRIHAGRESRERDAHTARLERQLAEVSSQLAEFAARVPQAPAPDAAKPEGEAK